MRLPLRPESLVPRHRQAADFRRGWLAGVLALFAPLSGCQSGHSDAVPDLDQGVDAAAPLSLLTGQGTNTVPLLAPLAQLRAAYVERGYSLLFIAHLSILRGDERSPSKVARLTRLYAELDYAGDQAKAQAVAIQQLARLGLAQANPAEVHGP